VVGLIPAGTVATLTRDDVVLIVGARAAILAVWRENALRNGRGSLPPDLVPLLDSLAACLAPPSFAAGSVAVPPFGDPAASQPRWISTREAADVIGVSEVAVRKACRQGRLVARPSGRGWRVDAADAVRYRAQRAVA
jgi:excisionase family DNA binding protein